MPSIPISDGLSVTADAEVAPFSSLKKYARDLPHLIASGGDLSRWKVLTLGDPAVTSLDLGLSFEKPVELGSGAPELTLGADAAVHFEVLTGKMFSPDVYGENLAIPEGKCAVRLGVSGTATAGVSASSGPASFGLDASAGISIDSYRPFSAGADAPTLLEALQTCVGELVIPVSADDVASIPAGTVVTLGGTGSLTLSASANLFAVANPLASLELPGPLPGLAVSQGASVKVGATWVISSEFQVRVHRVDKARVRLGWYRKHSSDFTIKASAGASVTAGTSSQDLFPKLIGAISSDARADEDELKRAGLSAGRTAAIEDAVKKAVSRKLEVAMTAELGSLSRDEAAFLYELDLPGMDDAAMNAVGLALRGDLSGLAEPPRGITEVRSILTRTNTKRFTFRVNLLGIFNFASISRLTLKGTVTFTPSTGELVIIDEATASRAQIGAVNFGPDEEKLRHVMADSFLITAAYRGTRTALAPPELKSTHSFFKLDDNTNRDEMRRFVMALEAIRLSPPALPDGITKFGRATLNAEANYDDPATVALFLREDGTPRPVEEYESVGRTAMRLLVPPDGDDAFRLRPLSDDALWSQMKDLGPANFRQLFSQTQAPVIAADYLAINWWADTMSETAVLVEAILRPGAADSENLRKDLAKHLIKAAARAHAQFGLPWGLVAMFLVSGSAKVDGSITSPRFVYTRDRLVATAT
jgi:hypothetical protein